MATRPAPGPEYSCAKVLACDWLPADYTPARPATFFRLRQLYVIKKDGGRHGALSATIFMAPLFLNISMVTEIIELDTGNEMGARYKSSI